MLLLLLQLLRLLPLLPQYCYYYYCYYYYYYYYYCYYYNCYYDNSSDNSYDNYYYYHYYDYSATMFGGGSTFPRAYFCVWESSLRTFSSKPGGGFAGRIAFRIALISRVSTTSTPLSPDKNFIEHSSIAQSSCSEDSGNGFLLGATTYK
jgi:hypothetical protein